MRLYLLRLLRFRGGGGAAEAAPYRHVNAIASSVYLHEMTLSAGQTYIFDTTSTKGQEVQHLFRVLQDGSYHQVSYGPPTYGEHWIGIPPFNVLAYHYTSRLTYAVPWSHPGTYVLLVRKQSTGSATNVDVRRNHSLIAEDAPAGGALISGGGAVLEGDEDDIIHIVPRPGGSVAPVVFALYGPNGGIYIYDVALHGGAAGASWIDYEPDATYYLFATPVMQIEGEIGLYQPRPGWASVYVNDPTDSDGDGLGDLLEQELELCWSAESCPYDRTVPQDTDRDGIPDGEELLGMIGDELDWSLPRWGANPLHMDAFVYVSWRTRTGSAMLPYDGPFDVDPVNAAYTWSNTVATFFRAGPHTHLANRNEMNGLHIHMNMGIPAVDHAEWIYGTWTPNEIHTLPPSRTIKVTAVPEGEISISVNGGQWATFDPGDQPFSCDVACVALLISIILDAHSLDVGYDHDSETNTSILTVNAATPGVDFDVQIATDPIGQPGIEIEFESNGSARNRADDPAYFPVDFRGRARFLVITGPGGGGQASEGRAFSGAEERTVAHELGHTFGISHWGHNAWLHYARDPSSLDNPNHSNDVSIRGANVNCMPHYLSMMNYAYSGVEGYGFSSSDGHISLNPSSVRERATWFGMDPEPFDESVLSPSFRFITSATGVDWDMSGTISGLQSRVRAPLRMMGEYSSCETFSVGRQRLSETQPFGDGALAQSSGYLLAFYVPHAADDDPPLNPERRVHYRVTELGPASDHGCGGTDDPVAYASPSIGPQSGCHIWSEETTLPESIDDVRFVTAYGYGTDTVYVASQSDEGALVVQRFEIDVNGVLTFQDEQSISAEAFGRPDLSVLYASSAANAGWTERLVLMHNEDLYGVSQIYVGHYLDSNLDFVHWNDLSLWDNGGTPDFLYGLGGASLAPWPHPDDNAPLVDDDDRVTCAIFTDDNLAMRPYCFDPVALAWIDVADDVWGHMPDSSFQCESWRSWAASAGASGRCIPKTRTPPNLTFRYLRIDDGATYPDARGNFGLTYNRTNETDRARLWISTRVSSQAGDHPLEGNWSFERRWDTLFYNTWFRQPWDHISVQQYDAPTTGGAAALTARTSGSQASQRGIFVYPFASGSFNAPITAGSDFRIMREYTCRRMAHPEDRPVGCIGPFVF